MATTEARRLDATEIARAKQIWAEYQRQHDVASLKGQAAGIDPRSGRVWIGESGVEIARQMQSEGIYTPLYIVRIGSDYYVRKGGRG